jgi:hypothetical protein
MDLTKETELKIKALFDQYVIANQDRNYLLTTIDKNAGSYYEDPKHPGQAGFSFIDTNSVKSLENYLNEFWQNLGTPEFSGMAEGLSELAFDLFAGHQTQSEDVSSFVYTMY